MAEMILRARRALTPSITEFRFACKDGRTLPATTPGAHVTVTTPSGANRRYSVINPGPAPTEYVISVKREAGSRGGSASMHDDLLEGDTLEIAAPENDFPLTEAKDYLLIAGGIGITPILSMARHLKAERKPLHLIYCTRSATDAAYLDEIEEEFGADATLHHDQGDPAQVYDFWDHFVTPKPMHVFCCGPAPLMEEIKSISGHWPEGRVHFEDFKPVDVVRADDVAFDVTAQKSGKTVTVPADRSILEALRDAGLTLDSSCESGTCGTCKCRLVSGAVDHRDMVLMDDEKPDHIMICVSRAREGSLVLDL